MFFFGGRKRDQEKESERHIEKKRPKERLEREIEYGKYEEELN